MDKIESDARNARNYPKEGDLYKIVETFGKTFELRYGYYEERDRESLLGEPAILYPDFLKEPLFTEEGAPFVTLVQDACAHYKGNTKRTQDTTCAECKFFCRGEEWFGICLYKSNQKQNKEVKSPRRTER